MVSLKWIALITKDKQSGNCRDARLFFIFLLLFQTFWNCFKLQLYFKQGLKEQPGKGSKKQLYLGSLCMENSLGHVPNPHARFFLLALNHALST